MGFSFPFAAPSHKYIHDAPGRCTPAVLHGFTSYTRRTSSIKGKRKCKMQMEIEREISWKIEAAIEMEMEMQMQMENAHGKGKGK